MSCVALVVRQRERGVIFHFGVAFKKHAFATAALALTAAMRHCDALAKSRIQNPFAFFDFQFHAYRLEAHRVNPLIRHVYLSFAFVSRRSPNRACGDVMAS